MKILHTSDWHLGKVLLTRDRHDEHSRVLRDLVRIARAEKPDVVLVTGDVFETASPNPASLELFTKAMLTLRAATTGVVAVIAGNHDDGAALDALRPWAEGVGITIRGKVGDPADLVVGGTADDGTPYRLCLLPFLATRAAASAAEAFGKDTAEVSGSYADLIRRFVKVLVGEVRPEEVVVVAAHLTVAGALKGGGERESQLLPFQVPSSVFPGSLDYVALGHLHRQQKMPGGCPIWYAGSLVAVDFGEADNTPAVLVVEASPSAAAVVRSVPLPSAKRLLTVRGTVAELAARDDLDGAWLSVVLTEPSSVGLRDRVAELLPDALKVEIDKDFKEQPATPRPERSGKSPSELFRGYLARARRRRCRRPRCPLRRAGRRGARVRPLLLDVQGFGVFRQPTRWDLRDAEFFALLGPTGAGKSTLLDAVIFALYGTAPRWDNKNVVESALAPSTLEAKVRLVFGIGPRTFVVTRKVARNSRTKAVTTTDAGLEELLGGAAEAVDGELTPDQIRPIASGVRPVDTAVPGAARPHLRGLLPHGRAPPGQVRRAAAPQGRGPAEDAGPAARARPLLDRPRACGGAEATPPTRG